MSQRSQVSANFGWISCHIYCETESLFLERLKMSSSTKECIFLPCKYHTFWLVESWKEEKKTCIWGIYNFITSFLPENILYVKNRLYTSWVPREEFLNWVGNNLLEGFFTKVAVKQRYFCFRDNVVNQSRFWRFVGFLQCSITMQYTCRGL